MPLMPTIGKVISLKLFLDSFVLAVLGFCISLSMGKPIAAMFNYKLDATHELSAEVRDNIRMRYISPSVRVFEYI